MDMRYLRTFLYVAELGSFTKASEALAYSQPTVSFQIRQLEQELNVRLFDRVNHTIALTQEGRQVLQYAHRINQLEQELDQALHAPKAVTGHIRMATADSLCPMLLGSRYADFRRSAPGVTLKIIPAGTDEMFRLLRHNEADLVLTLDSHIYHAEYVIAHEEQIHTHFVASSSSPLARMASLSVAQLADEMWFGNEIIIYDIEASCTVVESSIGWLGFISEDMTYNENFDLEELELIPEFSFTDLTYNEESKSYSITDNGAIYEFKFENGALTHMLMLPESANIDAKIEITNVGATVVEIPNYDIANDGKVAPSTADESVRTTVTNEELAAMFDMTNFTFHCVVAMDGAVADMFIKVDEKGLALKASDGSQTATQYYVLIDGEFYMLQTNSEGKYEPVAEDGTISEMVTSIELIKENLYLDTHDFFVGIVVFLSINFVNTPPNVSIPSDNGVTSSNTKSLTSPDNTPA